MLINRTFKAKLEELWARALGDEREEIGRVITDFDAALQSNDMARLNTRLEGGDAHPLEAIVTRMLLTKVKLEPEDEDVDEPTPENPEEKNDEDEKPQSITSIIKISLTVLVIGYALGKIAMLFS